MSQHIADEEALRTARRDALAVLLSRAGRGVLVPDEAQLLRQHVETEMRDADTARTERDEWAGRCGEADADTDIARRNTEIATAELRVLRSGLRANGADPTQIQNLWTQIRLRNKQWREAKQERDQHAAAIERVRRLCELTIGGSVRAHAVQQALDTLDALAEPREQ